MKKLCAMLLSASLLNSSPPAAADDIPASAVGETAGFGIGAILGGLIGGPPGAVLGAAAGAIHGNHGAQKNDAIADLEKQLAEKNLALAFLQNELHEISAKTAAHLHQASLESRTLVARRLGNGVSFPVYFRTNDSALSPDTETQVRKLAALVRDYPEIMVRLDAYADERGLPSYNLQLSKARALAVHKELARAGLPASRIVQHAHGEIQAGANCGDDPDLYVFDRRVDIRFMLETETSI